MANSDWGDSLSAIGKGVANAVPLVGPAVSTIATEIENDMSLPTEEMTYREWLRNLAMQMALSEYQWSHENDTFNRNLKAQRELLDEQRQYEQDTYEKYSSPAAVRRQMIEAGMNPMFSENSANGFQMGTAPSVGNGSEMGMPNIPNLSDFVNAGINRDKMFTERFGVYADVAKKAFDTYLANESKTRDEQRLGNETKELQARVEQMYSSIDLNEEQRKNLAQLTANLYQQNRENDYNLQFLAAVLPQKIERELLTNNMMKAQTGQYNAYASLLAAQESREKFGIELDKVAKEHSELALDFDVKTFTDRLHQVKTDRRISEEELKLAKQAYQIGLADVAHAALEQLQTERTIDFERLNENILRDLQAEQYSNMAADIKAHVADMILDRSMKLLNGMSNAVTSYSTVRGNQIRMYNARTRRMEFGTKPWSHPNVQGRSTYGSQYNPSSSWME